MKASRESNKRIRQSTRGGSDSAKGAKRTCLMLSRSLQRRNFPTSSTKFTENSFGDRRQPIDGLICTCSSCACQASRALCAMLPVSPRHIWCGLCSNLWEHPRDYFSRQVCFSKTPPHSSVVCSSHIWISQSAVVFHCLLKTPGSFP